MRRKFNHMDYVKIFPAVLFCVALVACIEEDKSSSGSRAAFSAIVLNDTGVRGCADQLEMSLACPVATHPGQDGDYGRDVSANNNNDGVAGFSFTKLDAGGNALAASATDWDCVRDEVTDRIWEVKKVVIEPRKDVDPALNLRASTNTFTWYDPARPTASADRGVENGGSCLGAGSCDILGYVTAINNLALCGFRDWRLPSRAELQSLVDYSRGEAGTMIDLDYFPNSKNIDKPHGLYSDWYWTSQTVAGYAKYAWAVNFNNGGDNLMNKSSTISVRLVREE